MIIKLTIENFKSFRESTTIAFTAGASSSLPGNLLRHRNGERIVKSMALYGYNASGKTTVLDALYALRSFVRFSSQDQSPTSPIPRFEPFALEQSLAKKPTRIAVIVDIDGARYTLDVSATAQRVWSESLAVQRIMKKARRKVFIKTLIDRTWDPVTQKYSTKLEDDLGAASIRVAAIDQTTSNRLMVGKLATMNSELAKQIIQWFEVDLSFYDMHRNRSSEENILTEIAQLARANPSFAEIVKRFIQDADIGIRDLKVIDRKAYESKFSERDQILEHSEVTRPDLSFRHVTKDQSEVFFRSGQESSGSLRFLALLGAILQPRERRRLVCIDELSASLHPALVSRLVQLIHSSHYNSLGNQVLFTTHDPNLIDPQRCLRRDQVTICNKNRFGASTTTRLDEFQDSARSDANLHKQYLDGRFGGLPDFGPTLEDVPVDDEPLEASAWAESDPIVAS